ncbi:MAG: restriction endonuclease subunit S [Treponema sp.]|nr:restriction endonuclease subunit S [Treponema sp.]
MNTKALKQKILDLAIHGKLLPLEKVEKIRKEEPASVLLEKIRAEKQEKIAKGELKKDKNDSFIFVGDDKRHYEKFSDGSVKDIEDEIPFDVPDGWSWCRLGEICFNIKRGKSPKYTDKSTIMAFAQKCNQKGGPTSLDKALYIDESTLKKYPDTEKLQFNDTVINSTGTGTLGRVGLFNCTIPQNVNAVYPDSHVTTVRTLQNINKIYTFYFIKNSQPYLESMGEGSTNQKELKPDTINNMFFPLPPLNEQQLIVAEIEKIFAQIDLLEQNKTDLQTAIKQAKSKILDLAIHGKLVPQDPNDESASVLLEKIRAEKEAKIAKGELKRDKNDSYIYKGSDNCHYEKINGKDVCVEEELPFAIPDNWQWCRLGEICELCDGEKIKKKLPYLDAKHFRNKGTDYVEFGKFVKANTYLILVDGENSGEIFYTPINGIQGSTFKILNIQDFIYNDFILYFIRKNQLLLRNSKVGSAIPHLNKKLFNELFLPLPPLAEQQRIVAKIEELFSLLDQIQNNLI